MKKFLLTFLMFYSFVTFSQQVYIPDNNFEQALINLGYDDVLDDYVLWSNISEITTLDISNYNIFNLTGIQAFTSLEVLNCSNNNIVESYNTVGLLNLQGLANLEYLVCNNNNNFTHINLGDCDSLKYLDCSNNNLISLDLGQNIALEYLNCSNNSSLTNLNTNGCNALQLIFCTNNVGLQSLNFSNLSLNGLDVSGCNTLQNLNCANNNLSFLGFNIDGCNALQLLFLENNSFENLDVSNCTLLQSLNIDNNPLEILNISNTQLNNVYIEGDILTQLDASNCLSLQSLSLDNNQLVSLDVSNCTALEYLYCNNNNLPVLDLSSCIELKNLLCTNNQLTELNVKNGFNTQIEEFSAINNPGLLCIQVDNEEYSNTNWYSGKDSTASFSEDCEAFLSVNNFTKNEIVLYPNPVTSDLNIEGITVDTATIRDVSGKTIFTDNKNIISIENLKTGIYFIEFVDENKNIIVRKVIKK